MQSSPEVTSVLGIARRLPDADAAPYSGAEWLSVDIQFEESRSVLAEAFASVDSVIHLAWLIQPNKERDLLRRVNVDGTRYVLEAAEKAGVGHIAVVSSVGAYSPVDDDRPRDEDWTTGGIPTSHYSVDKAAQERVLDEFSQAHPEIAVARLRPGLIFQGSAGAEIQRYFVGKWAPVQMLSAFRPPVVPLPNGLRAQAVHADDVAAAFVQAVVRRVHGAFNICADDLLTAETISQIIGHGRHLAVPGAALRLLLRAAHRAGAIPMDEGWLDMAHRVPVMDNSRAAEQLGWSPQKTAAEALEELILGMARGSGTGSVPMRPRRARAAHQDQLPGQGHRLPEHVDPLLLRQYMADHLAGATAGLDRVLQKLARPGDERDVVHLVRRARRRGRGLRPMGSGHSSMPLMNTDDVLVSLDRMSGVVEADPELGRARILTSTGLNDLGAELEQHGLAMENLGDVDYETIAGALGTGTHSSGITLGNLSSTMIGGRLVTGDRRGAALRSGRRRGPFGLVGACCPGVAGFPRHSDFGHSAAGRSP